MAQGTQKQVSLKVRGGRGGWERGTARALANPRRGGRGRRFPHAGYPVRLWAPPRQSGVSPRSPRASPAEEGTTRVDFLKRRTKANRKNGSDTTFGLESRRCGGHGCSERPPRATLGARVKVCGRQHRTRSHRSGFSSVPASAQSPSLRLNFLSIKGPN